MSTEDNKAIVMDKCPYRTATIGCSDASSEPIFLYELPRVMPPVAMLIAYQKRKELDSITPSSS